MLRANTLTLALILALASLAVHADTAAATPDKDTDDTATRSLPEVEVRGRSVNLIGDALSASEGLIGSAELSERPLLRAGDLVEFVPGLIATQHSGSGKANQYFLRGFNLDHGTDFAVRVDGMPVNLRSHGHGQGYSDLNFLIPETLAAMSYRKGPYRAADGDFATAGAADFVLADRFDNQVSSSAGRFGYQRLVATGGIDSDRRGLSAAVETQRYEGPWADLDEDVGKRNGLVRYREAIGEANLSLTAMGYRNRWNAPDQIPERAVETQQIDRFGSLDDALGGRSRRESLSAAFDAPFAGGEFNASAYWIRSELDLWSNFTYALDDAEHGDQFHQFDRRDVRGASLRQAWEREQFALRTGVDLRIDAIDEVGLARSQDRIDRISIRDDVVDERSVSAWVEGEWRIDEQWRAVLGLRGDRIDYDVRARESENSGRGDDQRVSPKASLIYSPLRELEVYASAGRGFHSNDARGAAIAIDPVSGDALEPVDLLAPATGYEIGGRWFANEAFQLNAALWALDLDSELIFVGDAGNTEATRASERRGVELGLYVFPAARFSGEIEASFTHGRFSEDDGSGRYIPGSIPRSIAAGLNFQLDERTRFSLRARHFGGYPLIEDGSQRSRGASVYNLRGERRFGAITAALDVFNLGNSDAHDIDYFYASRLPGEAASGVEDVHFHPLEPRSVRLSFDWAF